MKLFLFLKLFAVVSAVCLLLFGATDLSIIETLRLFALGIAGSMAVTYVYPEIRGIRSGDPVSVITNTVFGRLGYAAEIGRKNDEIRIRLPNGSEISGVIEDYGGVITHPRVRIIFEEKLIE